MGTIKMRNKIKGTIFFILPKEIAIMLIIVLALILYQFSMLVPVIFISDIIWNSGEKPWQPATNTMRRKTRNCISKFFAMKRLKILLNLNENCPDTRKGHTIDKLYVSSNEIGKGSNGGVVFEGSYEGREVAVKRLPKAHNKAALKEVQNLIKSDHHPNIMRCHSVKCDKDYVYLVLERCICTLNELVRHQEIGVPWETKKQGVSLWRSNGYPSELLLKLMRDMVEGLAHLHELGIIHGDIKPQNVMVARGRGDVSSRRGAKRKKKLDKHPRSSDMFSLGCVFHFCLSRGVHLFDHKLEDGSNRMSLDLVNHIPEAVDLISRLLHSNPKMRPKANQVLHHPLFWDSDKRLCFLRDVSDRLERKPRKRNSKILVKLESVAQLVFGAGWDRNMEPELVKDIKGCRRYRYTSLQHLIRAVRNKLNHYYESSNNIQELLGPLPDALDAYFSSRFPRLLMEVYKVVIRNCRSEKCFEKYFGVESVSVV